MIKSAEDVLNVSFDDILFQLSKGNTIEGLKNGRRWDGFEQVKEWKSKFGYQFHIYSNDHFLDKKPHFHIIKESENIDCRLFFYGTLFDCKGKEKLTRKLIAAIEYFVSTNKIQNLLSEFWNLKNPQCFIKI